MPYYGLSLEHIMPQQFEENWGKGLEKKIDGSSFKNDEERIQYRKGFVYQIGNMLVITKGLNSSIKNYSLEVKIKGDENNKKKNGEFRSGYKGYKDNCRDPLTIEFIEFVENNNYEWTEKEIKKRTDYLTEEILNVWSI